MKFTELFVGSDMSFGTWDINRKGSAARTELRPPRPSDYQSHLEGKVGLGLVPVRADGTCRFGAIDIDVDNIDHRLLAQQVAKLQLPLCVCRSKSGGAHLYVFLDEPGLSAVTLRKNLLDWSKKLGYGTSEVFPKQTAIGSNNQGNWINLPYFHSNETTRFAVASDGSPLSLEAFEEVVGYWSGQQEPVTRKMVDDRAPAGEAQTGGREEENLFKILNQGSPCVEKMVNEGIREGTRNHFLYNVAIAAKRIDPAKWKELVKEVNSTKVEPPLSKSELEQILRSVAVKDYKIRCKDDQLQPYCNFQECQRRPYGVQYRDEKDDRNFDQPSNICKLRKLNTDPPRYRLEIDNEDIELDTDEFLIYGKLRRRVIEVLNKVLPPMKQERWELHIKKLLETREEYDAPVDASRVGIVWERCKEFLQRYHRAKTQEDLLKELPWKKDEYIYFRFSGLFRFLSQYRLDSRPELIYEKLKKEGGNHRTMRIKGKVMAVWSIPAEALQEQTESFDPVDFPPTAENEL